MDERKELNQLRCEVRTLREEREILQRAAAWCRAGGQLDTTEVFRHMKAQEDRQAIGMMSRVREVSRCGFYSSTGRQPSRRAREDSESGQPIQHVDTARKLTLSPLGN